VRRKSSIRRPGKVGPLRDVSLYGASVTSE
jgi:hypothetical protein